MLTPERMHEIDELVDAWTYKEKQKEEYPTTDGIIDDLLNNPHEVWNEENTELLLRASQETGVSIDEFKEWFDQWQAEEGEKLIDADCTEEQLRDLP